MGNGRRVPLRFSQGVKVRGGSPGVKGFGVYAGCLVGLKGRNGGGGVFVVDEVMLVSLGRVKWVAVVLYLALVAPGNHSHHREKCRLLRLLSFSSTNRSCWQVNRRA